MKNQKILDAIRVIANGKFFLYPIGVRETKCPFFTRFSLKEIARRPIVMFDGVEVAHWDASGEAFVFQGEDGMRIEIRSWNLAQILALSEIGKESVRRAQMTPQEWADEVAQKFGNCIIGACHGLRVNIAD